MKKFTLLILSLLIVSCNKDDSSTQPDVSVDEPNEPIIGLSDFFSIDFTALPNYKDQYVPVYITEDNAPVDNDITNEIATLGRILFYDKSLSSNNTIACASCHKQEDAFGDTEIVSTGVNGTTARHSMRLINTRYGSEERFFWDKRASSLEEQTTMPIQDHIEMGFSGEDGDLSFNDLITKMDSIAYYPELFNLAFGTTKITEVKMQSALAQFIRSIQSFDSKYDEGRLQVDNDNQPFPNYTDQENVGKDLFLTPTQFDDQGRRISGGIGCTECHQAPEFDLTHNSRNNGIIGIVNDTGSDLFVTRSPSLRDLVKANGTSNGPFMHTGFSNNLMNVINHYNRISPEGNPLIDARLMPNGIGQQLNMTRAEKNAVIAFIKTLSGTAVYTDERWSNPFIN